MDDETRKQMNVEETFAALDRIIGKLEKGDGSLEDAFADYEDFSQLQVIDIQCKIFSLNTAGMLNITVWNSKTSSFICDKTIK